MGIGVGIALFIYGAILTVALEGALWGMDLDVLSVGLMVFGAAAVVVFMVRWRYDDPGNRVSGDGLVTNRRVP